MRPLLWTVVHFAMARPVRKRLNVMHGLRIPAVQGFDLPESGFVKERIAVMARKKDTRQLIMI